MTYKQAIEWLEKNVPTSDYDEFSDWYQIAKEKLNTPNLFSSPEFNKMLEDVWLNQYGSFTKQPTPIDRMEQKTIQFESPTIPEPKEDKIPVILPEKEITKPVVVIPPNVPPKEKQSILTRIKNFFRRKK